MAVGTQRRIGETDRHLSRHEAWRDGVNGNAKSSDFTC